MKNKTIYLTLVLGTFLFTMVACSNEQSSNNGLAMDSVSVAERTRDEVTLSTLKAKKLAAEKNAEEAIANSKEAKQAERDAIDAATQADEAFETEEAAQESRQEANDQANRAEKASTKAEN